jgi:hypothetical protein
LKEDIQLPLFGWREGVHLAACGLSPWDELDRMVPGLGLWQYVEGFLGEYIVEFPEVIRNFGWKRCTVPFEGFRESLGDGGCGSDLGGGVMEPSCEHAVSFFKLRVLFVLVILEERWEVIPFIFHHDWERSGRASGYEAGF